jgi:peroxiredoxin
VTVVEFAPLAAKLLLSAIFLVAGLAKLADPKTSVQALRDFGAPRFVQPFGVLLAPLELAVAVGLLFTRSASYAAWGALGLLVLFIGGIAINLARGRQPDCHCFGQVHVRPISSWTLFRNGVLATCAAWLIARDPTRVSTDLWVFLGSLHSRGRRVAMVVAALIVFAALSALQRAEPDATPDAEPESIDETLSPLSRDVATPSGVREYATMTGAADATPQRVLPGIGLPVGTPAPGFVLSDRDGQLHSLDSLRASGKPVLIVFSNPHCMACQKLAPKLPALAERASALQIVLISRHGVPSELEHVDGRGALLILLQHDGEVSEAYDSVSTPAAVIVGSDGVIQSRLAIGASEIEQLLSS